MECTPKNVFGLFGTCFFVGWVAGSSFFPRLSDIFGRKKLAIFGNILHSIAAFILVFGNSMKLNFAMNFFMGLAKGGRSFVGYVWMTENMRVIHVPKITAVYFFVDSLGIFVASIWFKYISIQWKTFYLIP